MQKLISVKLFHRLRLYFDALCKISKINTQFKQNTKQKNCFDIESGIQYLLI